MPDNRTVAPEIYLMKNEEDIILNQEVFYVLGDPQYVQFLWDKEKFNFAVQAFNTRMQGCFTKSELVEEGDLVIFHSPTLVNAIWDFANFKNNCVYKSAGSLDSRLNRINFDFKNAEKCGSIRA